MTTKLSNIAVISNRQISWIADLDDKLYCIDIFQLVDEKLTFLSDKAYDLLLIDDDNALIELESVVGQIIRNYPLISIIVLSEVSEPDYVLKLIELGIDDVFHIHEEENYLVRRLDLAIRRNQTRQMSIQHNRHLNSVTIVSRHLHNGTDPNNLITDALKIVSSTFNLMGLAIVVESGGQFHLRAYRATDNHSQPIYDVITNLHPYDPLRQSVEKGLVMVFEDLSQNQFMVQIPVFDKLHSALVVPLRYVNITLGAIMAFGQDANPLTRDDIVIYEHLATHLGSAYQNVRHSHTQDVSVKVNRHLLRTWQHLSSIYSLQEVSKTIQTLASEINGVKKTLVWLYGESQHQPVLHASDTATIRVFEKLYAQNIIDDYINQFDTQLRPIVVWLGRSNTRNIGELFQVMGGQQLIWVPIKDEARLLGCLMVSSKSNEEMNAENLSLLEGIAHAAGQTLERNMFMQYQNQQTEHLKAIARSIRDGVFFVNESQVVVFCNPQLTELTGVNQSLVINQSVDILFNMLAQQSYESERTHQQLLTAMQQLQENAPDQDHPIVEVYIPSIDSRIYIEFMLLTTESRDENRSWIGVLRDMETFTINENVVSPGLVTSILNHIQLSTRNIYRDLVPLNQNKDTETQKAAAQLKRHSQEIEQLLILAENFTQLEQLDRMKFTLNDPNKLLSVILNKPPLLQYDARLDVRTSLKDIQIRGNRQYIMQTFTSLIEVGLSLSVDTSVLVQMGAQNNRLVFRVVTNGHAIPMDQLHHVLAMPDERIDEISYSTQLRLYFIQQVIQKHDGELRIKRGNSGSMQFNIILPVEKSVQQQDRIPERRLSNIMVFDTDPEPTDVTYQALFDQDYEVLFCDHVDQIYDEVDLFRVDAIIMAVRKDHEDIIDFVKRLRQQKQITIPILILSKYNTEDNRVRALRAGVDVYIGLPISDSEFLAQVDNLFERAKLPERVQEPIEIGDLNIDFAQRQVVLEGRNINLTRIEYELLSMLALNIGKTLTHTELLTEVWGPEYKDDKNYLWVNMSRLRRKLEKTKNGTRYIFTQPGIGYILKES